MLTTHISRWATANQVAMDRNYISEDREGGTHAVGEGVPGLTRDQLSVLTAEQWQQRKAEFIYESWVEAARRAIDRAPSSAAVP
jgi:hypothetical protein